MSEPKVAIVTGASSGIGRACAIALSAAGWSVALTARRKDKLEETKGACKGETLVIAGDITSEEFVKRVFNETIAKFGRLDLLFNNAGATAAPIPVEDLPLADFLSILHLNVTASFMCTQQAVRQFKAQSPQGGRVINNGSLAAHTPRPHSAPYATTKHAITGLTKSTALDGRVFDITCTQIDIGAAKTEALVANAQASGDVSEAAFDVEHVASTIVHVASLPRDVQVLFLTIMASKMPFVGRG